MGRVSRPWEPVRRAGDDELVGYLVAEEAGVVPVNLLGCPLGAPTDRAEAERRLVASGLSSLAEPWTFRTDDGSEVPVRVLSATPERAVVVQTEYGYYGPDSPRFSVRLPAGDRFLT